MTQAPIHELWYCAPQVRYRAAKVFFPGGSKVAVVDFQRSLKKSATIALIQKINRFGIDRKVRLGEKALADAQMEIGRYLWNESILPEVFIATLSLVAKFGRALCPDLELVRLRQLNAKLTVSATRGGRVTREEIGSDFTAFLTKGKEEQLSLLIRMGVIVLSAHSRLDRILRRAQREAAAAPDLFSDYLNQFSSGDIGRKRAVALNLLAQYRFLGAVSLKGIPLDQANILPKNPFSLGISPLLLSEALHTISTRSTMLRDLGCRVKLDKLSTLDPLALTGKTTNEKLRILTEIGVIIFPAGKTIDDLPPPPQPTRPAALRQPDLFGQPRQPKK